jgi:hypothetical protein
MKSRRRIWSMVGLLLLRFWGRFWNDIGLCDRFIQGVANLRDNGFAEGTFRRLFKPAEQADIVKVSVMTRDGFADFGDALETDDAAVGDVFLPSRDFVEGALKDLAL